MGYEARDRLEGREEQVGRNADQAGPDDHAVPFFLQRFYGRFFFRHKNSF
jgi:hypothetical protein